MCEVRMISNGRDAFAFSHAKQWVVRGEALNLFFLAELESFEDTLYKSPGYAHIVLTIPRQQCITPPFKFKSNETME